jgi:DNA polymerase-1
MKLALLDANSLAYRAFYALPADLATPAGQVTNAVFGFTSMLIKLLGDEQPDAIAAAWDVKGPTFRSEAYPEYKAQRASAPDLFRSQVPLIRDVLEAMEIVQIGVPEVEADDVIATLAKRAKGEGWEVVVVTGDRDAFQLITDGITVLYTRRGISDTVTADAAWVEERYGVAPSHYVEYAALRGDSSDNLPGVPGVGEKTAAKLITEYGGLEEVFASLDGLSPKLRENLAASEEQVRLNRRLMELVDDVPLPEDAGDLAAMELRPFDHDRVRAVFDDLAFRSLWDRLQELGGLGAVEGELIDVEVATVRDPGRVAALADRDVVVIEPIWEDEALLGVVVAGDPASYVPAESLDPLLDRLRTLDRGIVAHDAKATVRALLEMGFDGLTVAFDTALAAYLVNPAQRTPDLSELAYRELGLTVDEATAGETVSQGAFDFDREAEPDLESAARRAEATALLVDPVRAQVAVRGGLELLEEIELPLIPILARMEIAGIGVDAEFLETLGDDLRKRLAELETEIHDGAGGPFNVNSTLQLREVLFERLELPVVKKTPKGAPSTDATVLEKLRGEHPVVTALLTYRELEKLRSTYVDALLKLVESDGRVRGRFNQMGAATGRLSQEQPNLQNIPVRSEEGRTIRRAFVAAPGHSFLVADYSQIELRILAHLSGDPGLVEAFEGDLDVHTATAARVAGVAPEAITPDQRRRAKMINFGLLYGMEAFGLAQRLEIDRDEAQAHIDAYFDQFPEVRDFMDGMVDDARASGYTTTLLGRRRYLPELTSSNFRDRQMGERMALNAPIQGSAADIIKKAMVVLDAALDERKRSAGMLLQIHDELVLEVPDDELDEIASLTSSIMENIITLRVPLRVDTATGKTLADCKE